jgi:murein DD-endopeptidase MepM/ murein hydrolase activator NlpD
MFAAVALAAYLVQPGDTLSGIAASHSVSLAAVEAANPHISNYNLIFAGQTIELPAGSSATAVITGGHAAPAQQSASFQHSVPVQQSAPVQHSAPVQQSAPSYTSPSSTASATAVTHTSSTGSSGSSSSSLSDIPGVPSSFAACVAYRESTDLQNPAANGNAYGIIPASGYNVEGASLAQQKQVFAELYAQDGGAPWAADGCPGT